MCTLLSVHLWVHLDILFRFFFCIGDVTITICYSTALNFTVVFDTDFI